MLASAATASDTASGSVLVSWVARDNDPFGDPKKRKSPDELGPTLTLLSDPESPWRGRITAVELLWNHAPTHDEGPRKHLGTVIEAIKQRTGLVANASCWVTPDPTDLAGIHAFLKTELPRLRDRYPGRELVINVSPGTPSMQTMWVLHGECGFVEPPFRLVRTYRPDERQGGAAVRDVRLGIDTFFSARQQERKQLAGSTERMRVKPNRVRSKALQRVYTEAARLARVKVPVLLLGERGTGKTTLAEWIRFSSSFRKPALDDDWPAVVCGQFIGDTMRAELFGWKKGAYTGATEANPGVLAKADGDTLFLDEIGDVPKDVQRLLIRALEDHVYTPLGTVKAEKSDFRLVTATNLPDDELRRRVDADFFDRISYARIRVPSLREMPEDIDWLWDDVYREAHKRAAPFAPFVPLPTEWNRKIVAALRGDPLPGNIRDLYRVAYRLVAARSDTAMAGDLSACVEDALTSLSAAPSLPSTSFEGIGRGQAARIYGAFAAGAPLSSVLAMAEKVQTGAMRTAFEAWLGSEIQALARSRGEPEEELIDVTERTLRAWRKGK